MSVTKAPTNGRFEPSSLAGDGPRDGAAGEPPRASADTLEIVREFTAVPGAIYHAWLDPDVLAAWIAPEGYTLTFGTVSIQPDIGGWQRFTLEHHDDPAKTERVTARLTELIEPRRIVVEHHVDDEITTTIELDIEGSLEGSRMRLRQYPQQPLEGVLAGWHERFDRLEQALARHA